MCRQRTVQKLGSCEHETCKRSYPQLLKENQGEHTTNLVFRIIAGLTIKCKPSSYLQEKFMKIGLNTDVGSISQKIFEKTFCLDR